MWKFLKGIGRTITIFRNIVINIIFLFIFFAVLGAILKSPKPIIKNDAPLVLELKGVLVDQLTYDPSLVALLDPDMAPPAETLVSDLVKALDRATTDARVNGLYLDLSHFEGGGISKVLELGQAINRFKTSKKPVTAYGTTLDQTQYLLASFADEILIHEMGAVALYGLSSYRFYLEDALDKIDMGFHVFRAGEFKDAVEPFVRNSMSQASREQNLRWLLSLWNQYTQTLERNRTLDMGTIANFIDQQAMLFEKVNGDAAQLAKQQGLVDKIVSQTALENYLEKTFGLLASKTEVNTPDLFANNALAALTPSETNIGYISAVGAIADGRQPAGAIGSTSFVELLDKVLEQDLDALVIRIDSGGGSAFASELIREKLVEIADKGLPVYVSMGSVAASGGYWIATAAKEIWALPSTITGSIGVFGLIPDFSGTAKKVGLTEDGVATTSLAQEMSLYRPLGDRAKRIIQSNVNHTYDEFLTLVANARKLAVDDVRALASGRVWIGSTAKELGLVDQLGSLHDLFEHIAQGKTYNVTPVNRTLTTREEIFQALQQSSFGIAIERMIGNSIERSIASVFGGALVGDTLSGASTPKLTLAVDSSNNFETMNFNKALSLQGVLPNTGALVKDMPADKSSVLRKLPKTIYAGCEFCRDH